ncbi:hypothetical protein ACS3SW_11755 [Roseobacteraceae bacterium S113]
MALIHTQSVNPLAQPDLLKGSAATWKIIVLTVLINIAIIVLFATELSAPAARLVPQEVM